ncbi:hypothetical protein QYF36_017607 [Acer negundo]|nr:hypothetical protein QYF36_017607 [Acer negundo]
MNIGGNSSTDQTIASSSSSNNMNTLPQPILLSSNNDIGKENGLMMYPSPMSDKNPIHVVDVPGHDNTTGETNVIVNQPVAVEHGGARALPNGHQMLINSNSRLINQLVTRTNLLQLNQQVRVNQPAAVTECAQAETNGGHEVLVNSNWLNQQVPVYQQVLMVMEYVVEPAETNGGHEQLMNSNWLNQQVTMNEPAEYELLMNYQLQLGQMMAAADNWDQLGILVQMPNPNSNMMNNPNYQMGAFEQFKNLNLNPPNLPHMNY